MTLQKLAYREIHIPIDLFKTGVIVLLSKDIARCAKNVRKWYDDEFIEWDKDSADGKTFHREGYNGVVIWLPRFPQTAYERSCLSHEADHAASAVMTRLRMPLNDSTEEVHSYLVEYIVYRVLKTRVPKKPKSPKPKKRKK